MSLQAEQRLTPPVCSVCCGHLRVWKYSHKFPQWYSLTRRLANVFARMFLTHSGRGSGRSSLLVEACTKAGRAWAGASELARLPSIKYWDVVSGRFTATVRKLALSSMKRCV